MTQSIEPIVNKMCVDAHAKYHVVLRPDPAVRDPRRAQSFHICHMFLHNMFKHQRPPPYCCAPGTKNISWKHLSDPNVRWVLIDDWKPKVLRTKDGKEVQLRSRSTTLQWVVAPDETVSRRFMDAYLKEHHVVSMAAPGKDGCGEPCGCGGAKSKHVSGQACDVVGFERLGYVLMQRHSGQFDDEDAAVDWFLGFYNLYRPLNKLDDPSSERWHVERDPKKIHPVTLRNERRTCSTAHGGC